MFNKTSNISTNDFDTAQINYASVISIVRIALVLLSRGGFILIQSGSIPTENSYDILLQNVVEFAVTTSSYGLFGILFAFGNKSYKGLIGYGPWDYTEITGDNIVFGFCVIIVGSAIITTILAGRLHFIGYVFVAFMYAGFSQPIIMHWMWHSKGWMNNVELLNTSVKVYDHAGGLIVHASGGLVGFIGLVFLGRRLLRLNDIDETSLGSESPNTIFLGYFLVAVALIGLSLPHKQPDLFHKNGYVDVVLINSILGLSGGIMASIILEFILWREIFNYWVLLRLIQGGISGLVLISSSINYCYPPASFAVSIVGATLVNCMSKFIYTTSLEDYCNIISIHLLCGFWSPIIQPFIVRIKTMQPIELLWQTICSITIMFYLFIIFTLLFLLLGCSGFLRNQNEENCHNRSLKVIKKLGKCPLSRLFVLSNNDDILEPGSRGKSPNNLINSLQNYLIVRESANKLATKKKSKEINEPKKKSKSDSKIKGSDNNNENKLYYSTKPSPKPKNIYTVHSLISNNKDLSISKEKPLCSGDTADNASVYKLEDLIANQNQDIERTKEKFKMKPKILRNKSHIKLCKSKRYVDFSTHKRLKKNWKDKKNTLVNIYVKQNSDLIAYDKKYNDGITTYKIPRFLEYISD